MDISKEYIAMCRKAVEVQELWYPSHADFTDRGTINSYDGDGDYFVFGGCITSIYYKKLIWLPRQDQLQGIYGATWIDFLCKFYDFVVHKDGDDFPSKEQAMLAFVMHEKFKKKW